ncbi:hypothetical protein, partial [Mesorhizobium sp.]|uniref:hypothetical protein n=1 Tax=Mesorhizobium sp. TaxID=1871066 RepID=UPI0025C68BE1
SARMAASLLRYSASAKGNSIISSFSSSVVNSFVFHSALDRRRRADLEQMHLSKECKETGGR